MDKLKLKKIENRLDNHDIYLRSLMNLRDSDYAINKSKFDSLEGDIKKLKKASSSCSFCSGFLPFMRFVLATC